MKILDGKMELMEGGTEVVWQLPPASALPAAASSASSSGAHPAGGAPRPRGTVFLAHGCHHSALDWWPRSQACPTCIGLPEETNVTLHCLLRGYAVVAISSRDREGSRCWEPLWYTGRSETQGAGAGSGAPKASGLPDWMRVHAVLHAFRAREGLRDAPLFGLGASSGGGLLLGLPLALPGWLDGAVAQIAAAPPGIFGEYEKRRASAASSKQPGVLGGGPLAAPWPPTLLAHMPRDAHTARGVALNVAELKEMDVPVAEVQLLPRPLTPLYLAQRCAPEISAAASAAIYAALKAAGYLDSRGYLAHNPRARNPDWRQIIRAAAVPGLASLRLEPDASPLSEEFNLLYAGHEISSEVTSQALDWLEARHAERVAAREAVAAAMRAEAAERAKGR